MNLMNRIMQIIQFVFLSQPQWKCFGNSEFKLLQKISDLVRGNSAEAEARARNLARIGPPKIRFDTSLPA